MQTMNGRVLLVDDDENLLHALRRGLRKQFHIDICVGGGEGLAAIDREAPYAVVVSDMRMPGMDGVEFLGRVRERSPDTVRMMLTGNTDLDTAMRAVNEGSVFRFITKPCDVEQLTALVTAGIRQYRLVTAERDLLEQTLQGAIQVCTEILSAADPAVYGQSLRVRDLMRPVATRLGFPDPWLLEVGALLARIGNAAIPPVVTVRHRHGSSLTGVERDMLARVPETSHALLRHVPRLSAVADIVLYSEKHFDGSGFPRGDVAGARIPEGSRALKIVSDFVALQVGGETPLRAIESMRLYQGVYDPKMLDALAEVLCPRPECVAQAPTVVEVAFDRLAIGDLLASNVETTGGVLVMQAGPILTHTTLERLRNFAKLNPIKEPIAVERRGAPTGQQVAASR